MKSTNEAALYRLMAVYSAVIAGVFFAIMYFYSGFRLSAPLDDAFIYFQ